MAVTLRPSGSDGVDLAEDEKCLVCINQTWATSWCCRYWLSHFSIYTGNFFLFRFIPGLHWGLVSVWGRKEEEAINMDFKDWLMGWAGKERAQCVFQIQFCDSGGWGDQATVFQKVQKLVIPVWWQNSRMFRCVWSCSLLTELHWVAADTSGKLENSVFWCPSSYSWFSSTPPQTPVLFCTCWWLFFYTTSMVISWMLLGNY